jgi:hypothetical protein
VTDGIETDCDRMHLFGPEPVRLDTEVSVSAESAAEFG